MSAWPRTLFHRNLFLIVALILLAQLASAVLFRELVMKPRVRLAAQAAAQQIEAVQAALSTLPVVQRQAFVARLAAHVQASLPPEVPSEARAKPRRLSPLERTYITQITQSLSASNGEVAWRRELGQPLSVQITLDGAQYWLSVPGLVPTQALPRAWIVGTLITAALAIWGAWLIQRRLNQPLMRVTQAASALGRGEVPSVLPEDGPTEIATVAKGFNEMVAGLARHEQERSLMLAGLSHDLRTPLTKMRLVSEMLKGQGDPALLSSLDRSLDGMSHLLDQFLDFTRASHAAGGMAEKAVPVAVGELVHDVLALCWPDGQARHDLVLSLPDITLQTLPVQAFRRALLNLLVNAQRHGAPPIEVAVSLSPDGLCVEVRDRGPGIPTDQLDALKQPFAQGSAARSHATPGAGLGLSIVERIVRAHHGKLALLPREGGGLIARMTWPPH